MKKLNEIIMLRADSQINQVEVANTFINCPMYEWNKNKDGTHNVFHLLCERVTKNGHAWSGSGIQTDIQHLYILSDDEIKEGDWCIKSYGMTEKICKYTTDLGNTAKKIIATTDPQIINDFSTSGTTFVPSIPQSFIEKYCELNGKIGTVELEYEEEEHNNPTGKYDTLKISNINEVIVYKIKESWTKKEIFKLLDAYFLNSNIVSQEDREIHMDNIMDLLN